MKLRLIGAMALAVMLLPSTARADLILEFGQGGTVGITEFLVRPGDTLDIEVYLTDTPGGDGLEGRGIKTMGSIFRIDPLGGPVGGATHQTDAQGDSTFAFSDQFPDQRSLELREGNQELEFDAVREDETGAQPDVGDSILLGTATLEANSRGTYGLELEAINEFSFILGGSGIDFFEPTPGAATLTAVPEPGTFAALGLVAGTGAVVRFRRRRKAAVA
jgi:hypothetical protein